MEIGALLHAGENEIKIEVPSSLNNRLLARGYYDTSLQNSILLMMGASNGNPGMEDGGGAPDMEELAAGFGAEDSPMASGMLISTTVQDYGMTGDVTIKVYRKK